MEPLWRSSRNFTPRVAFPASTAVWHQVWFRRIGWNFMLFRRIPFCLNVGYPKRCFFAYAFEWMGVKRSGLIISCSIGTMHNLRDFIWFYNRFDRLFEYILISHFQIFCLLCHVRRQCPALEIPLQMMARWQHWNIPSCQQRPKPWTLRGAKKGRKKHRRRTPVHPK